MLFFVNVKKNINSFCSCLLYFLKYRLDIVKYYKRTKNIFKYCKLFVKYNIFKSYKTNAIYRYKIRHTLKYDYEMFDKNVMLDKHFDESPIDDYKRVIMIGPFWEIIGIPTCFLSE